MFYPTAPYIFHVYGWPSLAIRMCFAEGEV